MKNLTRALAVAVFGLAGATAAQAQTAQTTFQVTANVAAACNVAATNLAFGAYLASAAKDTTSTITVTCTNGLSYDIGLGATPGARTMAGPASSVLTYGMFLADLTTPFSVTGASGSGAGQSYTVHGRIPAGQFVQAGDYSDTVTVLVSY